MDFRLVNWDILLINVVLNWLCDLWIILNEEEIGLCIIKFLIILVWRLIINYFCYKFSWEG